MQQYFVAGQAQDVVTITDKDTVKHMFNVMRLTEDDQVVLVFEDGIKRLARVTDRENHVFEVIEEAALRHRQLVAGSRCPAAFPIPVLGVARW